GAQLAQEIADATGYRFDLRSEIPWRIHLLETEGQVCNVLLVLHHIVIDHASIRPLVRDLLRACHSRRAARSPGFPVLPLQISDYILRQEAGSGPSSSSNHRAQQLTHWKSLFRSPPPESALNRSVPLPCQPCSYRETRTVDLDATLHAGLLAL